MKKIFFLSLLFFVLVGIFFSCKKKPSCEDCNDNKPPLAIAGPDQVITLPTDSISLDGSASNDPDGTISEWLWKKISGPASFNMVNAATAKTTVRDLNIGVYKFELVVKDKGALAARDTVQIIVNDPSQPNRPPLANAGTDQTINLPNSTINLDASGSTDPDNNITSHLWTKISGPSTFNIANANAIQTQITNLVEGLYQFELKVTDAGGLIGRDTAQIIVQDDAPVFDPNGADVYVVGYGMNANNTTTVAKLWHNGVVQDLTDGQNRAEVNSVFVTGNDVYAAGDENHVAKYWKNGVAQNLGSGYAYDVFVSGTDVFVAGSVGGIATLWKNGVAQYLHDAQNNDDGFDGANSVFVSGSDVYIAGHAMHGGILWKNSVGQYLNASSANSVFVSGTDVYVAGSVGSVATLWKNGVAQYLSNGQWAISVFVSGNDIYVAGGNNSSAILWKNGVAHQLSGSQYNAETSSVYVTGGDAYVVGRKKNTNGASIGAKIWKNGIEYNLNGLSAARDVFVK